MLIKPKPRCSEPQLTKETGQHSTDLCWFLCYLDHMTVQKLVDNSLPWPHDSQGQYYEISFMLHASELLCIACSCWFIKIAVTNKIITKSPSPRKNCGTTKVICLLICQMKYKISLKYMKKFIVNYKCILVWPHLVHKFLTAFAFCIKIHTFYNKKNQWTKKELSGCNKNW